MAYASSIDRLTDSISNLGGEQASNVDEMRSQFDAQESKAQEKQEKAQEASSVDEAVGIPLILAGGGGLLAGAAATGAKTLVKTAGNVVGDVSKGVKQAKSAVTAIKNTRGLLADNVQNAILSSDVEAGVSGLAETDFTSQGITSVARSVSRAVGKSVASVVSDALPDGALKTGLASFATGGGEDAVTTGLETGVLSSLDIPVIGEATAVIGGLALIGDSIYNLFHKHHQAQPPAPPGVAQSQIPQLLTTKFSSAVPSIDTATDRSGSSINF